MEQDMIENDKILNSKISIRKRLDANKIYWLWPILLVFARLVLAFIAQGITAIFFIYKGNPTPWAAAAPWWVVNGTLIDLGCLFLISILIKKEGIRFRDLINVQISHKGKFILQCIGYILLFLVLLMMGGIIFGNIIYKDTTPPVAFGVLPLWAAIYSVFVWPIIWGITEQLTYFGYSLPRIEAKTNSKWVAVSIVGIGWCIQHIALPFSLDSQWILYRFTTVIPLAIVLPFIFLKTRRLLPLIIAHWFGNFISAFVYVLLPLIQSK